MGCPGGYGHDPIYLLSIYFAFRANFSLSFPRKIVMVKKDRCAVFRCNNDYLLDFTVFFKPLIMHILATHFPSIQRVFSCLRDQHSSSPSARPFTSFSVKLSGIVHELHRCLLQALMAETHATTKAQILKVLK